MPSKSISDDKIDAEMNQHPKPVISSDIDDDNDDIGYNHQNKYSPTYSTSINDSISINQSQNNQNDHHHHQNHHERSQSIQQNYNNKKSINQNIHMKNNNDQRSSTMITNQNNDYENDDIDDDDHTSLSLSNRITNHHNHRSDPNQINQINQNSNKINYINNDHNIDDDEYDYDNKSENNDSKEYRKKLFISLAMLLPAIAAIIGVMAWAISAEVVLGAKREAQRRSGGGIGGDHHHDFHFKLPNRYDYTRFTSAPLQQIIQQQQQSQRQINPEMLITNHEQHHDNNHGVMMNDLQQKLQTLSQEFISRRNDNVHMTNDQQMNQENLAQLLAKILVNHQQTMKNSPQSQSQLVVPSQSPKSISIQSHSSQPRALELKIASSPTAKETGKSSQSSKSSKSSKQKQPTHSTKHKKAIVEKSKSMAHPKTVPSNSKSSNKVKNYEKELDSLLTKIENLEKQKYSAPKAPKPQTKKELFGNKDSEIVKKLRKFMESAPKEETDVRPFMYPTMIQKQQSTSESQQQQWEPMPPPPPPPPLPMPFMPAAFMPQPPPPPPPSMPEMAHHPNPNEMNPNMMMNNDNYKQSQMAQAYPPPQQPEHGFSPYMPPLSPVPMPANVYQQQQHTPQAPPQSQPHQYQQQPQMQSSNQVQTYVHPSQQEHYQHYDQQPSAEPIIDDMVETTTKKPSKLSQISRRFQLSKIFTSVMPLKSKKAKKPRPPPPSSPDFQYDESMPPPPPMMAPEDQEMMAGPPPSMPMNDQIAQESRYKASVNRGGYRSYGPMEAAGMQVRFGGGPVGGGSQVKVNPMAILKTLAFPMMKRPALNLNGKVVLGIVLENGASSGHGPYRKPKTVFQHYSTGRIKR